MPIRILCVLLFVALTGEWSRERDPVIYEGHWRSIFVVFSPLFDSIPGLNLFPWQVLFLAMVPVCLLARGARTPELDVAIAISLASIGITFMWGWTRGGSAYMAYYQTWRFMCALLLAVMLQSAVRSPKDLKILAYTIVLAAVIRGALAIYFYWEIVRGWKITPAPAYMTTHDDSLLFIGAILIVVSWAVMRGGAKAWFGAALVGAHLLYAMVLNDRRIAWVELVLAFGLMILLLPRAKQRKLLRWLPVAVPLVLAYVALGWESEQAIFAPLKAFSTVGSVRDSSSLARQEEIRNLIYTLTTVGNPLLGTGWGVPYIENTSIYTHFGGGFNLYPYLPHNSLLGVAVFSGFIGIFGIWLVVPVTAMIGMQGYRGATHPIGRAAGIALLCFLPAYGVQCYGDIGFQGFTCALLLGVAAGTAGKLAVWAAGSAKRKVQERGLRQPQLVA